MVGSNLVIKGPMEAANLQLPHWQGSRS